MVEVSAGHVHISHLDGKTGIEGVPSSVPLKLIVDVTGSHEEKSRTASCLIQLAAIAQPVAIDFEARSAFEQMQQGHLKQRGNLVKAILSALAYHHRTKGSQEASSSERQTARMRKGCELRELLRHVNELQIRHKTRDRCKKFA